MNPLVSIITPTYNSSGFVEQTIQSIIQQSYKEWELLITDDCSKDQTVSIIKKWMDIDSRIKFFQLAKNSGPSIARNNSLKFARGKYIAFCDSDDYWYPEKLEKQVRFLQENNLFFTYSSYRKINENGDELGVIQAPPATSFIGMLKSCEIGCLTAIYDLDKIGKVEMPNIPLSEDYGLWLKIFKIIGSTKGMGEVLAYYRVRKSSISSNKLKAAKYHFKVIREIGGVSFLKACYYFVFYAVEGLKKYLK